MNGTLSGAATLASQGGTLQITGAGSNTFNGITNVSAGLLQLNKSGGNAIGGGTINISGTGQMALLAAADQIADTTTINFTGISTDPITTQVAAEAVENVIVNSSVGGAAGGQVIMRNNFTVLGTGTLTSGVLGVASTIRTQL